MEQREGGSCLMQLPSKTCGELPGVAWLPGVDVSAWCNNGRWPLRVHGFTRMHMSAPDAHGFTWVHVASLIFLRMRIWLPLVRTSEKPLH